VPLCMNDIQLKVHPSGLKYMCINIKRTKTKYHGFTAYIGCSGEKVCAVCDVCAFVTYLSIRQTLSVKTDALFVLFLLFFFLNVFIQFYTRYIMIFTMKNM
jgi:hypothetical protein